MFKYVRQFGDRLVQRKHYASEDIKNCLEHLQELRQMVHETWDERKDLLAQCFDFQVRSDCEGFYKGQIRLMSDLIDWQPLASLQLLSHSVLPMLQYPPPKLGTLKSPAVGQKTVERVA